MKADGGSVDQIMFGFGRTATGEAMGVLASSFVDEGREDIWHQRLKAHYGLTRPEAALSYLEFGGEAVVLRRFGSRDPGRNPSHALIGTPQQLAARAPYLEQHAWADQPPSAPLVAVPLDVLEETAGFGALERDRAALSHAEHAVEPVAALLADVTSGVCAVGVPPDSVLHVVRVVRAVLQPVLGRDVPTTFSEFELDDDWHRTGLPALIFTPARPMTESRHRRLGPATQRGGPVSPGRDLAAFLVRHYLNHLTGGSPENYARWIEKVTAGAQPGTERVQWLDECLRGDGSGHKPGPPPLRAPESEQTVVLQRSDLVPARLPDHDASADHPPVVQDDEDLASDSLAAGRPMAAPPAPVDPARRAELERRLHALREGADTHRDRRARHRSPQARPLLLAELAECNETAKARVQHFRTVLTYEYGRTGQGLRVPGNVEWLAAQVCDPKVPVELRAEGRRFAESAGLGIPFDAAVGAFHQSTEFSSPPEVQHRSARILVAVARIQRWWYRSWLAVTSVAGGGVVVFLIGYLFGRGV